MKKNNQVKKVRWDPIIAKLAENAIKQKHSVASWQQKTLKKANTSKKRRSQEEFEMYLRSLFANDNLKVKYQNPDAWRIYDHKKKGTLV